MAKGYSLIDANGRSKEFNSTTALFGELSDDHCGWHEGSGSFVKKNGDNLFHTSDYCRFMKINKKMPSLKGILKLMAEGDDLVDTSQPEEKLAIIKNYSTVGLLVSHPSFKDRILARVEFDVYGDDNVHVYLASANDLSKIDSVGGLTITRKALSELPDNPYNDMIFAKAAFKLLGVSIC